MISVLRSSVRLHAGRFSRWASTAGIQARRLEGRSVIVTGGANGIGAAVVTQLYNEGALVTFADLDAAGAETTLAALSPAPGLQLPIFLKTRVDVEAETKELVERAHSHWGRIDGVVNNAVSFVFGEVDSATEADWDRVLAVNVKGYAFTMKHAVPLMAKQGGGSIVNVASVSGKRAQPAFVPYSTSKAAILGLSRNVGLDVGRHNIRVNAVLPGPILTDGTRRHAASLGLTLEQVSAEMVSHLALKRMGAPAEVARVVAFLLSDEASFMTASEVHVDGGYCAM